MVIAPRTAPENLTAPQESPQTTSDMWQGRSERGLVPDVPSEGRQVSSS